MFFLKLLFPRANKTSWGTSRGLTDRDINTLYAIWRKICNAKKYGYRDVMVYMVDSVPIPNSFIFSFNSSKNFTAIFGNVSLPSKKA